MSKEAVNHPAHYNRHPSGVECITIVEYMTFCSGNAVKYVWRAGEKTSDPTEDLKKARWYVQRELGLYAEARERELPTDTFGYPFRADSLRPIGGVSCISIVQHMTYPLGRVIELIWVSGEASNRAPWHALVEAESLLSRAIALAAAARAAGVSPGGASP